MSRLNYYGYRYYDPLSLQWTQADPLFRVIPDIAYDEPRRMSLYSFSLNNPVRYLDPDGRNPKQKKTLILVGSFPNIQRKAGLSRKQLVSKMTRGTVKRLGVRGRRATGNFVNAKREGATKLITVSHAAFNSEGVIQTPALAPNATLDAAGHLQPGSPTVSGKALGSALANTDVSELVMIGCGTVDNGTAQDAASANPGMAVTGMHGNVRIQPVTANGKITHIDPNYRNNESETFLTTPPPPPPNPPPVDSELAGAP